MLELNDSPDVSGTHCRTSRGAISKKRRARGVRESNMARDALEKNFVNLALGALLFWFARTGSPLFLFFFGLLFMACFRFLFQPWLSPR